MLRYLLYFILAAIAIGLVIGGIHLLRVSIKNKKEMQKFSLEKVQETKNLGKVLVIYYSMSGNTKAIAQKIQSKTGADLYEIKTTKELPSSPQLHLAIKNQLKTQKYPEIDTNFPNMDSYDIIFVGSPVWWYTVSTPVLSFLKQVDFKGKKIVPFSTQGSNPGTFLKDFIAHAKNAEILQDEKFNNLSSKYDDAVENKISIWINGLHS